MTGGLTILVSGMVASDPGQGGATWAVLQYLLGLRRLGHRPVLIEPITDEKLCGSAMAESRAAEYFGQVVRQFGLGPDAALLRVGTTETVGASYRTLVGLASKADLLLNIAGMLTDSELVGRPARRAYIDLDPAFTQLWHSVEGIDMRLAGHERHVTVGLQIGTPQCTIPTCGADWIRTPPFVALDAWPVGRVLLHDAFTTVGNWRGYGSIVHNGVRYGQRAHSVRDLIDLPGELQTELRLAFDIHPDEHEDLALLRDHGWNIIQPRSVATTPDEYQRFVAGSKAEFGVAKSGYVVSRSGWFSDRSACYLASGRPVVAQDTGFDAVLPVGKGLLHYRTVDEAAEAIRTVERDYEEHRLAARRLAQQHLSAEVVLPRLLGTLLS